MAKEYYNLLEIQENASQEDIKKAYRSLAIKYHPDKNRGNKESEDKFKKINEAYETLSNEQKRKMYDAGMHGNNEQFNGFNNFSDGFSFFDRFAQEHFNNFNRTTEKEIDIRAKIIIPMKEAFSGISKKIVYQKEVICKTCMGSGGKNENEKITCSKCNGSGGIRVNASFVNLLMKCDACNGEGKLYKNLCKTCNGSGINTQEETITVDIPAGVDSGFKILKSGFGHKTKNGRTGDFSMFIEVENENKHYQRRGKDVYSNIKIPFHLFFTEDEINIQTLHGEVKVKINKKHLDNMIKIPEKGFSILGSDKYGDMYIKATPEIPKDLPKEVVESFKNIDVDSNLYPEYFNHFHQD